MKKGILTAVAVLFLIAGVAWGQPPGSPISDGSTPGTPIGESFIPGSPIGDAWWLDSSLTFWAPFDNPADPLKLNKGTGSLTFTRATTATYVPAGSATGYIETAASGILRIEANGALIEGARTNLALWSRDMTNAAWVKTTMTAALDQTGEDGVANSASSLLATGGNGTCLQRVAIAGSTRDYSVSLKRLIGTGNVDITLDNGATWTTKVLTASFTRFDLAQAMALATPVNAAFSTAATGGTLAAGTYWYRVSATNAVGETLASPETSQVTTGAESTVTVNWGAVAGATGYKVYGRTTGAELLMATVGAVTTWIDTGAVTPAGALPATNTAADALFGIRIVTDTDKIAVDYNGLENVSSFPSSRIPTTTAAVTRNGDELTMPTSGNVSGTVGTVYVEARLPYVPPTGGYNGIIGASASSHLLYRNTVSKITTHDGTNIQDISSILWDDTGVKKFAVSWNPTHAIAQNGTIRSGLAFDGDYNLDANIYIGNGLYGYPATMILNGNIKNLRIWNRAFTDAEMQAITQ